VAQVRPAVQRAVLDALDGTLPLHLHSPIAAGPGSRS
jgi:hypothetical protein